MAAEDAAVIDALTKTLLGARQQAGRIGSASGIAPSSLYDIQRSTEQAQDLFRQAMDTVGMDRRQAALEAEAGRGREAETASRLKRAEGGTERENQIDTTFRLLGVTHPEIADLVQNKDYEGVRQYLLKKTATGKGGEDAVVNDLLNPTRPGGPRLDEAQKFIQAMKEGPAKIAAQSQLAQARLLAELEGAKTKAQSGLMGHISDLVGKMATAGTAPDQMKATLALVLPLLVQLSGVQTSGGAPPLDIFTRTPSPGTPAPTPTPAPSPAPGLPTITPTAPQPSAAPAVTPPISAGPAQGPLPILARFLAAALANRQAPSVVPENLGGF